MMDSSYEFTFLAILLIFLVRRYKALVYYVKFGYYYSATIAICTFLMPVYLFKPKNCVNLLICSAGLRHLSKLLGITWTIRNGEILAKEQTCVVVANHQTSLDAQGMNYLWPTIRKMTVIAKREILYVGTYGISMLLAGLKFIDRKAGGKAGQFMNEILEELKKDNIKLWVFPEGTRRNTGEIHQFKKGAFMTAINAQVPIVPVVFSSYKHFLDTDNKVFGSGEVILTVLPEISTQGLTSKDVESLIEKTRNAMIKTYNETSQELEAKQLKIKNN